MSEQPTDELTVDEKRDWVIDHFGSASYETWLDVAAVYDSIHALTAERDEADRRAGAAERQIERFREQDYKHTLWNDKAKAEAGYPRNTSFDIVWKETLKKAKRWEEKLGDGA